MPSVEVEVGGRSFEVACQAGEEPFLQAAARLLNAEAQTLLSHAGRIPEAQMLLMAGLMLADKTAGLQESLQATEHQVAEKEAELNQWRNAPQPEPEKIRIAVVPDDVTDALSEIAARAEAMAEIVDPQSGG